ncbi:biosynthetic-type acetolactate synthase large subunit [Desulfitibacter alkalitolerans]|uniref:biosynthetic-type acetolactate synthase large subunit n=1 Tax=Desulfitibacter alkalitolerans TaxID=264641 RepID=UPI00048A0264|nr:biosynthetic-type acetolactate synthase large subunit [Desulfitibacter alkalitolerans]
MEITGAQCLIKALEEQEVEVIYGYPGGAVLPIYDVLLESSIKHVLVRQEQAAVHAASGYARTTGKVGVCMATSGPGATNLVTGIATAYMDSIPLVIITGQVSTQMVGTDAFQEVDITGITMPITKHNYLVKDVKDLSKTVKEAFHIASTGRPGPVLIDIPKNVSDSKVKWVSQKNVDLRGYKPTYYGHPSQIKNAALLINNSARPVILSGGGVINSNSSELVKLLAERIQAPVATTLMGLGSFPADHESFVGMLGMHGTAAANYTMSHADLIIGLGVRFDDRATGAVDKFAPKAKVIHIDIDPAEIGKNVRVNLPIVGDVKLILEDLVPKINENTNPLWLEQIKQWKQDHALKYPENVLTPQYVISILSELAGGDTIVTTDVGQHQMWTALYYKFNKPRTLISSGGLGTMGYGFPAAIGAQYGNRDKRVIAVTGDGSFQMHMAEMGTAMEHNLPIKILLFNNSCLGLVRQLQYFYCEKKYSAIDFSCNPDFMQFARCYGAAGYRITCMEEARSVLEEALNNDKLTIIECMVPKENLVHPMVLNTKGLDEMELYR